jgi:hypothetical protein
MEQSKIPQDMLAALKNFDVKAEQLVRSFIQKIDLLEPPSIIYHYTNDVGLKGILETGQLRLTDIFNLNDPSELSHGFSHAVKILNRMAAEGPPESKLFCRQFSDFYENGLQESAHYFVCSFSSCGDDLGQWRAYADNGRGYALGFEAKSLEDSFVKKIEDAKQNDSNSCTFHVTYDETILEDIHKNIIECMFELISMPLDRGLDNATIKAYMGSLSVSLSVYVLQAALFFKHKAYKNESEYRFLQIHRGDVPPPEVKRRFSSYELVKYREFDWKAGPNVLKKIVVGPAANADKAKKFAEDCLSAFEGGDVEIVVSPIPYRAV